MSYNTLEELSESKLTLIRAWLPNGIIPDRSVTIRDNMEDTIRFYKKVNEPDPIFDVKFQIPCDTILSSSSCYQDNKMLFLVR